METDWYPREIVIYTLLDTFYLSMEKNHLQGCHLFFFLQHTELLAQTQWMNDKDIPEKCAKQGTQ